MLCHQLGNLLWGVGDGDGLNEKQQFPAGYEPRSLRTLIRCYTPCGGTLSDYNTPISRLVLGAITKPIILLLE